MFVDAVGAGDNRYVSVCKGDREDGRGERMFVCVREEEGVIG